MSALAFMPLYLDFWWCAVWCAVMCGFQALPDSVVSGFSCNIIFCWPSLWDRSVVYDALNDQYMRAFDDGVWWLSLCKFYFTCRISVYFFRNKGFLSDVSISHFRLLVYYTAGICGLCMVYTDPLPRRGGLKSHICRMIQCEIRNMRSKACDAARNQTEKWKLMTDKCEQL